MLNTIPIYAYLNIYWGLSFGEVGDPDAKIKNRLLGGFSLNHTEVNLKISLVLERSYCEIFIIFYWCVHFDGDFY